MYLLQRVVCTGNHTSGIGPHSSTHFHRAGRPWHRNQWDRTHLCHCSIQEDRMCWQTLCMAFQKLWSKTKNNHTFCFPKVKCIASFSAVIKKEIKNVNNSSLKPNIMLTWQLAQQLPAAQVAPRANVQVAASQQSLVHSCMKWKQNNCVYHHTKNKKAKRLFSLSKYRFVPYDKLFSFMKCSFRNWR